MDHGQAQEAFSDYWDQTLDAAQRKEVDAHLEGCAACRAEYEAFQKAMAPLGKLHKAPPPVSVDLQRAVPEIIHRRSKGRFFGPKGWAQRRSLEWIALGALGLIAATYFVLKLLHPVVQVQ